MKRYGLLSVFAALVLTACGNGSVKSPDFEPELQSIEVTPDTASVGAGESLQFKATGTFSSQPGQAPSTRDLTSEVSWSSSSASVASIGESTGLAVGGSSVGTTTITASRDGKSDTATLTSEGRVLRSIKVTPPQGATAPGGTVDYTAQGVYSDSPTPQDITDAVISWTIANPSIGTLSPTTGRTVTATGVTPGLTTIKASAKGLDGTAQFGVGQLTKVTIDPPAASSPVGRAFPFQAIGTYSPTTGSSATFELPIPAKWTASNSAGTTGDAPTLDSDCEGGKAATLCKVAGHAEGSVDITATVTGLATPATAKLTVTAAALDAVQITPDPLGTTPRTTPDNVDLPLGASQNFYPLYYYSDFPGVPVVAPRTAADKVVWSSSDATTVKPEPAADNSIKAITLKQGTANVVATAGSIKDTVVVKVGPAEISDVLSVRPAKKYLGVGRQFEFTAVGLYSTGETKDIADGAVTWTSSDPSIASIDATTGIATAGDTYDPDANSVTITATLNTDTTKHADASLIVTPEACETPLTAADGATATEGPAIGICLLCGVTGEDNVIDTDLATFGVITVGVGALDASRSIDVTASADDAPYAVPFAAGSRPSFIIANANGPLVLAEVTSQIQLSTLLNGAVQESTDNPVTPLRLDLLGVELLSLNKTQGLVSFATSLPYDGIRLQLKSGLATALSTVEVGAACGTTLLPVQPASGISSLEAAGVASDAKPNLEVGASLTLVAHDYADPTQALNADDVTWTSGDESLATVSSTGVVTGVGAGDVVITGTLKDTSKCGTHCSATRTITVTPAICEVPLQMTQGASIDSLISGICLACSTSNLDNVIDALPQTYGQVYLPLTVLPASVTVTATVQIPYAGFTAGPSAGFVLAADNGALLTASIGNQIVIRTLKGGTPTGDTSSNPLTPLRLDLLGTSLVGSDGVTAHPVFISKTTQDFDAVQISFNTGLLSALSSYRLYTACGKGPAAPAP